MNGAAIGFVLLAYGVAAAGFLVVYVILAMRRIRVRDRLPRDVDDLLKELPQQERDEITRLFPEAGDP